MTEKQKKLEVVKVKRRHKRLGQLESELRVNLIAEDLLKGMTPTEAAKKYDVNQSYTSYIKRGIGFDDKPHMSFVEIGEVLGISKDRARVVYGVALKKMKVICIEMEIEFCDIVE